MRHVSLFGLNLGMVDFPEKVDPEAELRAMVPEDDAVVIPATYARISAKAAAIYTEYVERAITPAADERRATGKLALYGAIMDAIKSGYVIGRTS